LHDSIEALLKKEDVQKIDPSVSGSTPLRVLVKESKRYFDPWLVKKYGLVVFDLS
jgi:ASC-1-like (ASCH) protein